MIEFKNDGLKSHPCLVVAFAGIGHALGGIPFEFNRTLSGTDCAVLFVRDIGLRWYQYDARSDSDFSRVAARIEEAKQQCQATRLVLLGNSMGGFGALLFSHFVKADAVLAFVPQTVIYPKIASKMGDKRWIDKWRKIPEIFFGDLSTLSQPFGRRTLVFGAEDALDRAHAERLSQAWTCDLLAVTQCGHDVASTLRDRGELNTVLASAISG